MDAQQGFADVNGTRLYYEVAGAGEAIVLIHGFTLDARMWDDQFAPFAAHHRVVRYDMRGFGKSAPMGNAPYAHTDDLAALLTHLTVARAAIVGLSMGGGVAVDFALEYPAMTDALIPVDATLGGHHWSEAWNRQMGPVGKAARADGIDAAKMRWLALPLFAPACEQPAVGARLAAMVADYSGSHWVERDPQRRSDPSAAARLGEMHTPTLVILGERDVPDFHVVADTLTQGIDGARKVVLPGAGHMGNMEAPDAFNREVLAFLTEV